MVVIKLQYGSDIRRVSLDTVPRFKDLCELASSLFSGLKEGAFQFKYKDDEGDLISVTSQVELQEAVRVAGSKGILKLNVVPLDVPTNKNSGSQEEKSDLADLLKKLAEQYLPGLLQVFDCKEFNLEKIVTSLEPILSQHAEKLLPLLFQFIGRPRWNCHMRSSPSRCPYFNASSASSSSTESLHRAFCDGCNSKIFNVRYKCNQCADYDLCEECKKKTGVHDAQHTFVKITDPNAVIHPAICDKCSNLIVGLRFKCNSCIDFDLCETCVKEPGVHDTTHTFSRLQRPFRRCPRRRCPRTQCSAAETQTAAEPQTTAAAAAAAPGQKKEDSPPAPKPEVKPVDKEPVKPVEKKEEKKEEPKKQEKPVEAPKTEEPKVAHPFEQKLKQLDEMGFTNRAVNISLLVNNKMDLVKTIKDLLEM
jgi:hypothetical protein